MSRAGVLRSNHRLIAFTLVGRAAGLVSAPFFDASMSPPTRRLVEQPPSGLAASAFSEWWPEHDKLQRVSLLKQIEASTADLYETAVLASEPSDEWRQQLRRVALESNLAGLEEFGDDWYRCITSKMVRMQLCASFTELACEAAGDSCGFDAFERALVIGAAKMLPAYNQYYLDFLAAVQDEGVGAALKARPPPSDDADIYSSYTVLGLEGLRFTTTPFARHFAEPLAPVLSCFDEWIRNCEEADAALAKDASLASAPWDSEARAHYIRFLEQYRHALSLDASSADLEAAWNELDRRWMDCKMPIQIVHDIETGYGDPLRVKATPDMSLRFLDESFVNENAIIADIQQRIEAWSVLPPAAELALALTLSLALALALS